MIELFFMAILFVALGVALLRGGKIIIRLVNKVFDKIDDFL